LGSSIEPIFVGERRGEVDMGDSLAGGG